MREGRGEIEGREQGLKERRRECFVLRDALAEVDVERARTGSDLDHLARECQQSVGIAAAEAAASLTDEDRARDLDALAALVQELRDKLERMGQVNVLAVEQAQELEERHTFLTAQRQDLLDSISELDQAIRKIDRASRERFQEAFQIINQHFGEMFKQLFGGGTAGLSLLDEEDLLESGIDIMAQPPGKRLQNVLLLSGGEKALTAIALLFAIFQYKPSPFCILDEVDAPLDDANIGRFVSMLEGLKEQTQFVLITHSRKTMEIADQLYGVTMEEPGVSQAGERPVHVGRDGAAGLHDRGPAPLGRRAPGRRVCRVPGRRRLPARPRHGPGAAGRGLGRRGGRGAAPTGAGESAPDDLPAPAGSPEGSLTPAVRRAGGRRARWPCARPGPIGRRRPDAAAVAAYFTRMDAVAAQVKATQDPEALARTILDQTLSGNMSGFDELITTQRALQARMAEVLPPAACREHHQRSLRLIGRAIALLERTRDAVAGKNPSDLASVATEGHAIEEEARATDALANDLRRAAGLPVVP